MDGNLLDGLTDSEGRQVHNPEATFSQALADAAARGGREAPAETTRTDPARDSAADILKQVGGGGESVATKDVQLGLSEGNPSKPTEAQPPKLEDLEAVLVEGEVHRGADVAKALEAGGEAADQVEFLDSEDAVQEFLLAADQAAIESDSGALALAVADLDIAVAAGRIAVEEGQTLLREAVLDLLNVYEEDVAGDADLSDYVDEVSIALAEAAVEINQARTDRQLEEAAPRVLAEEVRSRSEALAGAAKAFAKELGLTRDAEAVARYNQATELASELYAERTGHAPDDIRGGKLDPKLWLECLRAADGAEQEASKVEREYRFHQSLLADSFDAGYSLRGQQQFPSELPEPVLSDRKVAARMAMRHSSAAEIKAALTSTEPTSVEEAIRQGAPKR